jgi:hypothetical protein
MNFHTKKAGRINRSAHEMNENFFGAVRSRGRGHLAIIFSSTAVLQSWSISKWFSDKAVLLRKSLTTPLLYIQEESKNKTISPRRRSHGLSFANKIRSFQTSMQS